MNENEVEMRFTSGQLCKIFSISKQTLLFYDKIDLLKSKYVDKNNGYRYYSLEQLDILYIILSMKDTGIPLNEIRNHLLNRTVEKTTAILENQIAEIRNKIVNLQAIEKNLQKNLVPIKQIENAKDAGKFSLKYLPKQYLLVMPVEASNGLPNYTLTISKITEYMVNNLSAFSWNLGCISKLDSYGNYNSNEMFAVIASKIENQYFKPKPAGLYACTYHYGSYSTIDDTYKKLLAYINLKGIKSYGEIYENYIINTFTTKDESNYITEITLAIV